MVAGRRRMQLACGCILCRRCEALYGARDLLWLRALEAWVEHEYPAGSYGRSAAQRVVAQVRAHVRRLRRVGTTRDGI